MKGKEREGKGSKKNWIQTLEFRILNFEFKVVTEKAGVEVESEGIRKIRNES